MYIVTNFYAHWVRTYFRLIYFVMKMNHLLFLIKANERSTVSVFSTDLGIFSKPLYHFSHGFAFLVTNKYNIFTASMHS